jgi:hypothetical protein
VSDEKQPRVRGLKEQEAAYKSGFIDGLTHAHAELDAQRALERERDVAMDRGLSRLRTTPPVARRTRRSKQAIPDVPGVPG